MAFHPPGMTHSDEVGSGGALFFTIELRNEWVQRLSVHSMGMESLPDLAGGILTSRVAKLYHDYKRGSVSTIDAESLVFEMMAKVCRLRAIQERAEPWWMGRVRDLLHASFMKPLTLEVVASAVGVHPVHLSRVFRTRCGQTLGEYVNGLRMQFVCERLTAAPVSLADLAVGAGFADQSHFCRLFKAMVGATPTEFRRVQLEHRASASPLPPSL